MALGFPILLHLLSTKENGGRIRISAPFSSSDPSLMHLFVLLSAKEMVLLRSGSLFLHLLMSPSVQFQRFHSWHHWFQLVFLCYLYSLFCLISVCDSRVSWTNGALPVPALQGARIQSKSASERRSSPQSPTSHASWEGPFPPTERSNRRQRSSCGNVSLSSSASSPSSKIRHLQFTIFIGDFVDLMLILVGWSRANKKSWMESRRTVTADDVVAALNILNFDNYAQLISRYLERYREVISLYTVLFQL